MSKNVIYDENRNQFALSDESGNGGINWQTLEGKPAVIAEGSTAQEARESIGAGTSSLVIGTTSTTAKAGDYAPTWAEVTGKPATFAPTIGTTSTTAKVGNYTPSSAEIVTAIEGMNETQKNAIKTALGIVE